MIDLAPLPPGHRQQGLLTPDIGHPVEIPYIIVKGKQEGPTLLVTGGIHGAEYASIEAAYRMADTDPASLTGTLVVLPIVNPAAFFARSIYINPVDGKNLNRMFPGRADGSFAERLAYWLTEEWIRQADAYIDLHGGDMIEPLTPFTIFTKGDTQAEALAAAFGIELLVGSESTTMTIAAAHKHGIPAILAEASGQGLWPEEEVERLREGVVRVMHYLGMLPGPCPARTTRVLQTFAWLRAEHSGRWYPYATAGEHVQKGQLIGEIKTLLGEVVQQAISPMDGIVLFSVSSLAMNTDDPLFGIGV